MDDLATLEHQAARAKDLLRVGQPTEALRLGLGDFPASYLPRYVPEHCRHGMAAHLLFGAETGTFLYAVLSNDLMKACGHADDINQPLLFRYALFLHNAAPQAATARPRRCGPGAGTAVGSAARSPR